MVGSSDKLTIVVVATHRDSVKLYGSQTIHAIKVWVLIVKLDLEDEKTEATLITNPRKNNTTKIQKEVFEETTTTMEQVWKNHWTLKLIL